MFTVKNNVLKNTKDQYGYLSNRNGSSKYYGINNTGPCNKGYRIKLSKGFMSKLGIETNSGFTTHTTKDSLEIQPEELAYLLDSFIDDPKAKSVSKFNIKDDSLVTMEIISESYAVVTKAKSIGVYTTSNGLTGGVSTAPSIVSNYNDEHSPIISEELKRISDEIDSLHEKLDRMMK